MQTAEGSRALAPPTCRLNLHPSNRTVHFHPRFRLVPFAGICFFRTNIEWISFKFDQYRIRMAASGLR